MGSILTVVGALLAFGQCPDSAIPKTSDDAFLNAVRAHDLTDLAAALSECNSAIVNARDSDTGESALHIAARRGDDAVVRFLIFKGADPNALDKRGNSPLLIAAASDSATVVPLLLSANARVDQPNDNGETPLIRAVQRRNVTIVRDLLKKGADPDRTDAVAKKSARNYARMADQMPALTALFKGGIGQ